MVLGAIVNQAFVKQYLKEEIRSGCAFGGRRRSTEPHWFIVGVVRDTKYQICEAPTLRPPMFR